MQLEGLAVHYIFSLFSPLLLWLFISRPLLALLVDLHIVVDPLFGQLFKLGKPSPRYHAFHAACVPETFVGTLNMMLTLVKAAAGAVLLSFAEADMPLPPWRRANSLMSRWLPRDFVDVPCAPRLSSSAATKEQAVRSRLRASRLCFSTGNILANERDSCQRERPAATAHHSVVIVGFEALPAAVAPLPAGGVALSLAGGWLSQAAAAAAPQSGAFSGCPSSGAVRVRARLSRRGMMWGVLCITRVRRPVGCVATGLTAPTT